MDNEYICQLLAGRDYAKNNKLACQMKNFSYIIGSIKKKVCFIIDPAWSVKELINIAKNKNMKIIGILATHYHQDHVGGNFYNFHIEGIKEFIEINPCIVHSHKLDAEKIMKSANLSKNQIIAHETSDKIYIDKIEIELIHTPGHTPGSCCFKTNNALFSGDTLFMQSCGRTDLPGSNISDMYNSITNILKKMSDHLILYPGHLYGGKSEVFSQVRKINPYFKINTLDEWNDYLKINS